MGIGFTLALCVVGSIRELLGNGTLTVWHALGLHWQVPAISQPALLLALPPGGFLTLGVLLAAMNRIEQYRRRRRGLGYRPPNDFDCRHCVICKWGTASPAKEETTSHS
jgi:electron transport complex protein RnfE